MRKALTDILNCCDIHFTYILWDSYGSKIMKYQKTTNLLDNAPNSTSRFKTKNWVEINDESWGTCTKDNQIRFKTSILRSSIYDYSDADILGKGTLTVGNKAAQGQPSNAANKKVLLKNCAPFTNCIRRINNKQVDDPHYINVDQRIV